MIVGDDRHAQAPRGAEERDGHIGGFRSATPCHADRIDDDKAHVQILKDSRDIGRPLCQARHLPLVVNEHWRIEIGASAGMDCTGALRVIVCGALPVEVQDRHHARRGHAEDRDAAGNGHRHRQRQEALTAAAVAVQQRDPIVLNKWL